MYQFLPTILFWTIFQYVKFLFFWPQILTFLTSKKCKINLIDLIKEGFNTKFLSQSIQRLYISHIKILVGIYCFAGSLVSGKITFSKYTYVSGNMRFPILYPTPHRIFPEIYVRFRKYTISRFIPNIYYTVHFCMREPGGPV